MKGLRLVPDHTHINFIGLRYAAYMFSLFLIVGSIGLTVQKGLNFGIDFTGGTLVEVRTPSAADIGALRTGLNSLEIGAVSIQEFGSEDDLLIRFPEQVGGPEAQKIAIDKVREYLDSQFKAEEGESLVDYRRTEFVGPQVGKELKQQGIMAVLFSLVGILAYVTFRFEWQFGVASVLALMHDCIITIGLFALTQMEFNLSTVAAILMIAGYSINDTVVVFDRIREYLRKYKKMELGELLNLSVNTTLSRTTMTSLTTVLAMVALMIFGGEVISGFVYALVFGITIGTYSSIFVASPLLLHLNIRRDGKVSGKADEAEEASQKA